MWMCWFQLLPLFFCARKAVLARAWKPGVSLSGFWGSRDCRDACPEAQRQARLSVKMLSYLLLMGPFLSQAEQEGAVIWITYQEMSEDKTGHLSLFDTSVTCRNTFAFSFQPWSIVEQSGGCFSLIHSQSISSHSFRSVGKYKTVVLITMCVSGRQWKRAGNGDVLTLFATSVSVIKVKCIGYVSVEKL